MDSLLSARVNRRQMLKVLATAGGLAAAGGLARLESVIAAPTVPSRWRRLTPKVSPSPSFGAAIAYDAARKTTVLFSGEIRGSAAPAGADADTWIWNGRTWTLQSPRQTPPARSRACFAYHPPTETLVLFGGGNLNGFLGDTWLWNGRSWSAGPGGPAARASASMAFDPATESLILFGGYGDRMLSDTWAWDGTSWRSLSPGTRPLPTRGATMAYSAALGGLILFGGTHFQGGTRGSSETWAWDGSNWSQLSLNTVPLARRYASMAADPKGSLILLFGGFDDSGTLSDTWTLASTWSEDRGKGPVRRAGAALAFDPSGSSFLLFGGGDGRVLLDDTWLWGPFE